MMDMHIKRFGRPCCGSTTDLWSLKSCREAFACFRASFVLDGDTVASHLGNVKYEGRLLDMCPILSFAAFPETRHTGAALARWKMSVIKQWDLEKAIGLATEDGASNNRKANQKLKQEFKVCLPHDLARCVLHASGLTGTPCKNHELQSFVKKASKQSASFNRSVIANKALQDAQLASHEDSPSQHHQLLTTKTMNKTRWLGLWEMARRNRQIGPEIRLALTGDVNGLCDEDPAQPAEPISRRRRQDQTVVSSSSEDSSDGESDGVD